MEAADVKLITLSDAYRAGYEAGYLAGRVDVMRGAEYDDSFPVKDGSSNE